MSYSKDILDALIETNKATMIGDLPTLKKEACLKDGYDFEFWIFDKK